MGRFQPVNHRAGVSDLVISLTTSKPLLSERPGGGWAASSSGPIIHNWVAGQWIVPRKTGLQITPVVPNVLAERVSGK